MKSLHIIVLSLYSSSLLAQTAENAPLPEKFEGLEQIILIGHFPSPVYASQDDKEPGTYFWKHNTTLLSPTEDITIIEGGAYIFYNNQWNHRVTYSKKKFSKFFKIPKGLMKAGEPYTFPKNWRRDSRLFGGWAMWYVIGTTSSGKNVFGIGQLDTVGEFFPKKQ